MSSIRPGFLKTLMIIAELRAKRMISVIGLVCKGFLPIINLNYTQSTNLSKLPEIALTNEPSSVLCLHK